MFLFEKTGAAAAVAVMGLGLSVSLAPISSADARSIAAHPEMERAERNSVHSVTAIPGKTARVPARRGHAKTPPPRRPAGKICCQKPYGYFRMTDPRNCKRAGGRIVPRRACRHHHHHPRRDGRVRDHRDGGRVRDHRDGGRVRDHRDGGRVRDHRDGDRVRDHRESRDRPPARICCRTRNGRMFVTTTRDCRRSKGSVVSPRPSCPRRSGLPRPRSGE